MRLFESDLTAAHETIVRAAYRARREHGYAGLPSRRIGDAFTKSTLLPSHYDDRDPFSPACRSFALERLEAPIPNCEYADARDRLEGAVRTAATTDAEQTADGSDELRADVESCPLAPSVEPEAVE